MLTRLKARMLLDECVGDEIWSADLCRQKQIPGDWIDEMADCYESGFRTDRETIYHEARHVNQYHGIRDRDLAFKLAEFLGVETQRATELALGLRAEVAALKEAADEL